MLFQMSLYEHIWVFCDEDLESCWCTFAVVLTENSHGGMQHAVGVLVSHKEWEGVFENHLSQSCI